MSTFRLFSFHISHTTHLHVSFLTYSGVFSQFFETYVCGKGALRPPLFYTSLSTYKFFFRLQTLYKTFIKHCRHIVPEKTVSFHFCRFSLFISHFFLSFGTFFPRTSDTTRQRSWKDMSHIWMSHVTDVKRQEESCFYIIHLFYTSLSYVSFIRLFFHMRRSLLTHFLLTSDTTKQHFPLPQTPQSSTFPYLRHRSCEKSREEKLSCFFFLRLFPHV